MPRTSSSASPPRRRNTPSSVRNLSLPLGPLSPLPFGTVTEACFTEDACYHILAWSTIESVHIHIDVKSLLGELFMSSMVASSSPTVVALVTCSTVGTPRCCPFRSPTPRPCPHQLLPPPPAATTILLLTRWVPHRRCCLREAHLPQLCALPGP